MQYLAQTSPAMNTTTILPLLRWLVSTETDLLMRTIGSHACSSPALVITVMFVDSLTWCLLLASTTTALVTKTTTTGPLLLAFSMITICSRVHHYLPGDCSWHQAANNNNNNNMFPLTWCWHQSMITICGRYYLLLAMTTGVKVAQWCQD